MGNDAYGAPARARYIQAAPLAQGEPLAGPAFAIAEGRAACRARAGGRELADAKTPNDTIGRLAEALNRIAKGDERGGLENRES